ncbi:hypothetical protein J2S98_002592 [Arthrobacter oryzae]|nr:hypothetical protein [Arthrobacter oryzae]
MLEPKDNGDTTGPTAAGESELLILLAPGDAIETKDRISGQTWHGTVDMVAADLGCLWIYAELGERKLINTDNHSITRPG